MNASEFRYVNFTAVLFHLLGLRLFPFNLVSFLYKFSSFFYIYIYIYTRFQKGFHTDTKKR